MPKTICVDFDATIHRYSKGWFDGTIYDPPIYGVGQALQELLDLGYDIEIYSTRCNNLEGRTAIREYLDKYDIPYSRIYDGVGKPLYTLLIDDNALRFEGDWNKTISQALRILGT